MALKIDMSKAYDRVEWNYLAAELNKIGFDHKVVNLFMACISSVKYKVLHAGRNFGSITPSRGIRQGDPLSSYLFLLCIEGFTALIRKYESRGLIHDIKVAQRAPSILHIPFTNDCFIFCKASLESDNHVKEMLHKFETTSGQQMNVDKSSVFFSRNSGAALKQELRDKLRFVEADENRSYLGLPSLITRKKYVVFGFIEEKLQDQIEVKICRDLERVMCKYWWKSDGKKERGIHWISWDRMRSRKNEGGTGFRNIRDFNVALHAQQVFEQRSRIEAHNIAMWKFVQDNTFSVSMSYMTQEDGVKQWRAPTIGRVKVDFDATIFENPSKYNHTFVIRDHEGKLIKARSRCCQGSVTPVLAKAMGVREALSWVKTKKQHNVEVETDCLELVQWIRSCYSSLSYLGRVVDDCRQLLAGVQNQNVMLRFVKRYANRVANYLARYNYLSTDRIWRMEDVHSEFYHVLCNDLK
ncbi:uncharacterized protein LOC141659842 [Apium graveolens]|uniref:uncharacterized protein LOC141659842 n=1 Tax=Apium graveolens TaxID=4045 RepID=UPI003D7AC569